MMHASQDSSLDGLGSSRDLGVLTTCRAFFMFLLRAHSYSERVARPMYQRSVCISATDYKILCSDRSQFKKN